MAEHSFLDFDHVQIAIPIGGEGLSREFYSDILGLSEIPKPEKLRAGGGVWYRGGQCEIHLGVQADFVPATKAHPGIRVLRMESLAVALESAGYPVAWDSRIPGRKRFFVQDPFGNRLEFLS